MEKNLGNKISYYLGKGWGVVPANFSPAVINTKGKLEKKVKFLPTYQEYHKKKIEVEEVEKLWKGYNGVAITTGEISGITVMDVDTKKLPEITTLPETFTVETNKGYHFYFKYTDKIITGAEVFKAVNNEFNIDIRNNGGIVYADPSEYELPGGAVVQYKIIKDVPVAEFPIEWLKNIYKKYKPEILDGSGNISKKDWKERIVSPIESGSRNMDFASIIGGMLYRFPMAEWESIVWTMVQDKNSVQKNPLSLSELRTTYESVAKSESQKRQQGGDIKDISVDGNDEEIRIDIRLDDCIVCFKVKNIISSLSEANALTWIQKSTGLTHEIPFYLKIKSDSNKEQWVRILSKAFDKKENKEIYPWTIIVAKVVAAIETQIRSRKQAFLASKIEPKEANWLYEPFIQEDQINTLFGMGSSGKTLLSLFFSKLIAQEFGHKTLFIDYEDTAGGWKNKLIKVTSLNDFTTDIDNFVYFDSEQIPLAEQVDKIKEAIKTYGIKLVIVDSASLATGESTSDEKAAVRLVSALKLLKTTVLLIAHQRKNEGDKTPIGSIQYENQSRNVWNIKGSVDDSDIHVIHIACTHTKANNTWLRREPLGYKIEYTDEHIKVIRESAEGYFEDKYSIMDRIKKYVATEGLTYKEIAEELGVGENIVKKNLTAGKKKGIFVNTEDGKWKRII